MRKRKPTATADEAAPKKGIVRHARTASGKKADASSLASARESARAGLRERTEEGHLMAGRLPPSRTAAGRRSGATRKIDDSIRSYTPMTEDEKLLQQPSKAGAGADF